jgi:hypothetical protein
MGSIDATPTALRAIVACPANYISVTLGTPQHQFAKIAPIIVMSQAISPKGTTTRGDTGIQRCKTERLNIMLSAHQAATPPYSGTRGGVWSRSLHELF